MIEDAIGKRPLTLDEATKPTSQAPTAEVRAWQEEQIRRGIAQADAGEFVTAEELKATIRRFLPQG